ncbi:MULTISPECIES: ABC transporter substrate-binding protein [unclassified Kribbella]|uniref:ABC transporter substrate-binding protein n=1 Tax=unclassified Kribbella TaxID=2644121 RepID=UPI0033C680C3
MKKVLSAAMVLSLGLLTACSGGNDEKVSGEAAAVGFQESGLPLVSKPVTLRFSGQKAPLAPDYNSMTLVKQWQQDTAVQIKWENLPENVYKEKKNLLLASGDLPDAFYNTGFTDSDIATYGANGTLIPLESLIDKYAPNLKKIFEKRPEIKAAVTASDGHIYSLPAAEELGIGAVPFFYSINTAWLKKLGLPMPQTLEQYHQTLQAFKTKDPNGNGKADEIPLSFIGGWWCADAGDLFAAISGVPDNPDHRIVRDDKVIYTAAQPEYREAISTLHQWYSEGLIDPETFTQTDKQYLAKGKSKDEVLGSFVWWETEEVVGAPRTKDYALMGPLEGPKGKLVGRANGGDYGRDAFAITRANKYPEVTMRWVDRLYDPVMSAQVAWGPAGEGLQKNASGVLVSMPDKPGESAGERKQRIAPGGPRVILKEDFKSVVAPEPRAAQRQTDLEKIYLPYAEKQSYPLVFFTQEELQRSGEIQTEIKALVDEKRASWIVRGGVEKDWDNYVKQLKAAGLDDLVQIYQTAYDRHRGTK